MIRAAAEKDISCMHRWYCHYVLHSTATFAEQPPSAEEFRRLFARVTERYPWIVLEEEGRIRGYAYLDQFNSRSAYRFTADVTIYLDPESTGKGYGSTLLRALIDQAKQDGYYKLVSLVTRGNAASEALHGRLGFSRLSVLENAGYKFGQWLDVVFYVLDLRTHDNPPKEPKHVSCGERGEA